MTNFEQLELILRKTAMRFHPPSLELQVLIDEVTKYNNEQAKLEAPALEGIKEDQ